MGLALWPVTLLSADFNLSIIVQKGVVIISERKDQFDSSSRPVNVNFSSLLSTLTSGFPPDVADVQLVMLHFQGWALQIVKQANRCQLNSFPNQNVQKQTVVKKNHG